VFLSSIITPVLVIGIILSGLCIIIFNEHPVSGLSIFISRITNNWFVSSLLYVSYNSILAVVMMCSMLPYLKSRRTAITGGIMGGASLTAAAIVINAVITLFYPAAMEKELPVMDIIRSFSSSAGSLYSVLLWLAMLTSAVASGYSFSESVGNLFRIDKRLVAVLLWRCGRAAVDAGLLKADSLDLPSLRIPGPVHSHRHLYFQPYRPCRPDPAPPPVKLAGRETQPE
jgi:uncharacterized membrane protein YkvI